MKLPCLCATLLILTGQTLGSVPVGIDPGGGRAGREEWVDSVFRSLTLDEKIAQLLVIRVYSNRSDAYNRAMTNLIRRHNVGGICFFQGSPVAQATLTNEWQQVARTPMLVAIDAEWGLGMRLDSVADFPFLMTLGASDDDSLLYAMASAIARDCRRIGVHLNLAPVIDVNNNPDNPVINFRSFGEDPDRVAHRGVLFMKGLQDHGILTTAKHFPGHGDTDADSHLELPVISHSAERLDSVELMPFRTAIGNGLSGIMTAHLFVPALDNTPGQPSSLSPEIVTGLLKEKMGFEGLIITDALDMKGVTNYFAPGEIEVRALLAGNDILLLPQDIPSAVTSIREAVEKGVLPRESIEERCKKLLRIKFDLGLAEHNPVSTVNLTADLNSTGSEALVNRVFKSAVTLVKNEEHLLPVTWLQNRQIASLSVGASGTTPFQQTLEWYAPVTHFQIPKNASPRQLDELIDSVKPFDLLIVGIHNNRLYPANHFGNPDELLEFLSELGMKKQTILTIFGNPYLLGDLKNTSNPGAILVAYQDQPEAERAAAGVIFGGVPARGTLPVTTAGFPAGWGMGTKQTRLQFVIPEEIGIPSHKLHIIDSLVENGIDSAAYPGCQVLLAKNGKVFFYKAFGHPQYGDPLPVTLTDLYDVASLTKVAATTLAIMTLVQEGSIDPDDTLAIHLPELRGTNKELITIREVMAHEAGLHPWIPFYELTRGDSLAVYDIYDSVCSDTHPVRVADHLYMRKEYCDSIFHWILSSEPRKNREYKYSDLGFYLLMKLVERKTGTPFRDYVNETFYKPLGLTTLGFLPRERFPLNRIIPTERDTLFRKQLIRGDVHDPGAAMLGGVSGHAGLFSDAFDLAVILQMLVNGGSYGGTQYFLPSTVQEFTRKQFQGKTSRRGMGFDKPPDEYDPDGPTCPSASPLSFGHSGFTGTYMWADPDNELIYVFLSNRVSPDAGNSAISRMNIRTGIHQRIYDILRENNGN